MRIFYILFFFYKFKRFVMVFVQPSCENVKKALFKRLFVFLSTLGNELSSSVCFSYNGLIAGEYLSTSPNFKSLGPTVFTWYCCMAETPKVKPIEQRKALVTFIIIQWYIWPGSYIADN